MPAWLTFTDNGDNTATLSGTPTEEHTGDHNVVLEVSDGTETVEQSFTITVNGANTAPYFTSDPVVNIEVNSEYSYTITVEDDNEDLISFSMDQAPAWLTLTDNQDNTALLTGTPEETGTYDVIIIADDGSLSATQEFTISVNPVGILSAGDVNPVRLYPNPVKQHLILEYHLKEASVVSVKMYSVTGEIVKSLVVSEQQNAGNHIHEFDVSNVDKGIYILSVKTSDFNINQRVLIME